MWDRERIKNAIESMLLVSPEPVVFPRLQKALEEASRAEIEAALKELMDEYSFDKRGIHLVEVAGGYQFRTSPQNADIVRKFLETKPARLTKQTLETIVIIAYRQPITRPEIDKIRGVDSGGIVANLLERGLIKILGRREVPGRPFVYGTTRKFLEVFSLKDLSELPSIEEIEEVLGRKGELQKILDSAGEEGQVEPTEAGEQASEEDIETSDGTTDEPDFIEEKDDG